MWAPKNKELPKKSRTKRNHEDQKIPAILLPSIKKKKKRKSGVVVFVHAPHTWEGQAGDPEFWVILSYLLPS